MSDAAITVGGLSDKDLVVEVTDDRIISGDDSWIFGDILELGSLKNSRAVVAV